MRKFSSKCEEICAKRISIFAQVAIEIGNQTGGRVFLFLHTDNFARDYQAMKQRGVTFVREPAEEDYGTVAVFQDLYGNKWDLLQLRSPSLVSHKAA